MPLHSGQKKDVSVQGMIDGACKWVDMLVVPRAYYGPRCIFAQVGVFVVEWRFGGRVCGLSVGLWTH